MKKLLSASMVLAMMATPVFAADVKLGIILGYTGPIESLTPDMAMGAELAISEANESGEFMSGTNISSVRGDSTCIDSAAATAAAERLITSDKINAMVGSDCSGVTTAILQNLAMANGVVMVSPSATSPALSTIEDNDLFHLLLCFQALISIHLQQMVVCLLLLQLDLQVLSKLLHHLRLHQELIRLSFQYRGGV